MQIHAEATAASQLQAPIETDPAKRYNRLVINHSVYKGDAAGSLALPTVGKGDASASTYTLVQDMYRARSIDTGDLEVLIGATVRLAVTVATTDANVKLTLAAVATNVEAGTMTAAYKFELLGTTDHDLFGEDLPTTGSYDAKSYLELQGVIDKCQRILAGLPAEKIDPIELFVIPKADAVEPIVWGWVMALRLVAEGKDPMAAKNGDERRDWAVTQTAGAARAQPDEARKGWALLKLQQIERNLDAG